jgi:hypothetical protein
MLLISCFLFIYLIFISKIATSNNNNNNNNNNAIFIENLEICCDEVKVKKRASRPWAPPPNEGLKFNVDGSFSNEQLRAGIGGVLRNGKGEVLCSFSAHIGNVDIASAELMAIQKACVLCASKDCLKRRQIVIESDSRVAVAWVLEADFGNLCCVDLIYDIRSLLLTNNNLIYLLG